MSEIILDLEDNDDAASVVETPIRSASSLAKETIKRPRVCASLDLRVHCYSTKFEARNAMNSRSFVDGDILYIEDDGSHPEFVFFYTDLNRGSTVAQYTKRHLVFTALYDRDDFDVVAHLAPVLFDPRIKLPMYVRLRPSNVSAARLLEPADKLVKTTSESFQWLTLRFSFGRLRTLSARLWRISDDERRKYNSLHHLSDRVVKINEPTAPASDALVRMCEAFLQASAARAVLLVFVELNASRYQRVSNMPLSEFLARNMSPPPHWRPASYLDWTSCYCSYCVGEHDNDGIAVLHTNGRILQLEGPAATRAEMYRVLQFASAKKIKPKNSRVLRVLPLMLPIECGVVMPKWQTAVEAKYRGHRERRAASMDPDALLDCLDTKEMTATLDGAIFRWSTQQPIMLGIVVRMAMLQLPVYVVGWILEWLDEPFIWRSTPTQRIRLIEGVRDSTNRVLTARAARRVRAVDLARNE